MTEEERKNRISKLLTEISPINYDRIFLSTKLHFEKETYFKTFTDELKQEIIKTEKELNDKIVKLEPLFSELRKLQIQYQIQYKAEYIGRNNVKYWETHTEFVFLENDCNIDTTTEKGWKEYMSDECVNNLLKEVYNFLFKNRFSNFDILNIRKL